jgi:hypothetical protein
MYQIVPEWDWISFWGLVYTIILVGIIALFFKVGDESKDWLAE